MDWLCGRVLNALGGDLIALLELLSVLNLGWLGFKGLLLAIQALKLLYQEAVGGLAANAARGRRVRMNTIGEEVRKTITQLGLLEVAKITVLKGAKEVLDQLKTGEKAAITA